MRASSVLMRVVLPLAACLLGAIAIPAAACPYAIRDAGFIIRESTPYKAYVYVDGQSGDTVAIGDALKKAARRLELSESNVAVECVDLSANPSGPKATHLPESARAHLPAAVLVSPSGRTHVVGHVEGRLDGDGAEAFVRSIVSSKARRELSEHLVPNWCVVVILSGATKEDTRRARQAAEAAAKSVVGEMTEMTQIDVAPHVIVLPHGAADDAILAWGLGLDPGATKEPQAAVVFGMGRRLGPVMRGKEITESALTNRFLLLGRNCTCTSDPSTLMGPATPLVWGLDRQQEVMRTLGFDPNSPAVATTLSGVWRSIGGLDSGGGREFALSPGAGYTEFALDFEQLAEHSPPQEGEAPNESPPADAKTGAEPAQAQAEAEANEAEKSADEGAAADSADPTAAPAPEGTPAPGQAPAGANRPGWRPGGMGGPAGGPAGGPGGGWAPGGGMNVPPVENQPPMPGVGGQIPAPMPGQSTLPPLRFVPPDDPDFTEPGRPLATQVTTIAAEGEEAVTTIAPAETAGQTTVESKGKRVLVIVISAVAFVVLAAVAVVILMSMRSR